MASWVTSAAAHEIALAVAGLMLAMTAVSVAIGFALELGRAYFTAATSTWQGKRASTRASPDFSLSQALPISWMC